MSTQTAKLVVRDKINIKMMKKHRKSVLYPLKLIFEVSLQEGIFPDSCKKALIVPIHRKEDENLLKSYRPISPYQIFGKMFKRVTFRDLFKYFHQVDSFLQCVYLIFFLVILTFHSYCLLFMKLIFPLIVTQL